MTDLLSFPERHTLGSFSNSFLAPNVDIVKILILVHYISLNDWEFIINVNGNRPTVFSTSSAPAPCLVPP